MSPTLDMARQRRIAEGHTAVSWGLGALVVSLLFASALDKSGTAAILFIGAFLFALGWVGASVFYLRLSDFLRDLGPYLPAPFNQREWLP